MQGGELEGSYAGIIPRTVQHLFNSAAALGDPVQFSVSFFEVEARPVWCGGEGLLAVGVSRRDLRLAASRPRRQVNQDSWQVVSET